MSFEILEHDLLGRMGKIKTRRGVINTPYMFPVVNPSKMVIPPSEMEEVFGCDAIITNAYLIKKYFEGVGDVHELLDFKKTVMTDSGAYQLLVYGKVDIDPKEVIELQERIGSDIAVILDVPTGGDATYDHAKYTVEETIKRAIESQRIREDDSILWVGPIQGGTYLDLLSYSATQMNRLDFDILAIGSPTQIMESYMFDKLTDMIYTVKTNVSPSKPIHLFGAGHPIVFSIAVALGCDLFDSASYAIFARDDRVILPYGTVKLSDLRYNVCSCPICRKYDPSELREMDRKEREPLIARHNLYVCMEELNRIRQAIYEGRLWQYVQMRARSHPRVLNAVKKFKKYVDKILRHDPVSKRRAFFYTGPEDSYNPSVIRHKRKMEVYEPPYEGRKAILLFEDREDLLRKVEKGINTEGKEHVIIASKVFGPIPIEIREVYPLSQSELIDDVDREVSDESLRSILKYLKRIGYEEVTLRVKRRDWWVDTLIDKLKKSGFRVVLEEKKGANR
ncbi:MAG: tRNA guanosine(15) transglycosylase TgtA [Candidatus Asgardarchaeia archaeon]